MSCTLADMVYPIHMFEYVWIMLLEFSLSSSLIILPDYITLQVLDFMVHTIPRALGTLNYFTDQVAATIQLAAHTMKMYTVFHFEIDAEVVILVTCNTALTATETGCLRNLITRHPQEHIDVMYMLFYDMITREPLPVHPVTDHPFHIAPTLFTASIPQHVLVPIHVTTSDFTNHTCLNLLVRFYIRTFMMTLSTCNDTQVLGLCLLSSSHDGTIPL